MDAKTALTDLAAVSSQVRAAVLLGPKGAVLASTVSGDAAPMAAAALALGHTADESSGRAGVKEVVVTTAAGSVFLVRDGERTLAAVTGVDPTVGLVLYDLRATLRSVAEKPKPKPRKKASDA